MYWDLHLILGRNSNVFWDYTKWFGDYTKWFGDYTKLVFKTLLIHCLERGLNAYTKWFGDYTKWFPENTKSWEAKHWFLKVKVCQNLA